MSTSIIFSFDWDIYSFDIKQKLSHFASKQHQFRETPSNDALGFFFCESLLYGSFDKSFDFDLFTEIIKSFEKDMDEKYSETIQIFIKNPNDKIWKVYGIKEFDRKHIVI